VAKTSEGFGMRIEGEKLSVILGESKCNRACKSVGGSWVGLELAVVVVVEEV